MDQKTKPAVMRTEKEKSNTKQTEKIHKHTRTDTIHIQNLRISLSRKRMGIELPTPKCPIFIIFP